MRCLLLLLLLFSASSSVAQMSCCSFKISFDDTADRKYIVLDTTHSHNGWQLGVPQKPVFNNTLSGRCAMVTDTLNPYAAPDTSIFYLKIPAWNPTTREGFAMYTPLFVAQFYYQIDIDTDAVATIEMSTDSGVSWYNIADTFPPGFYQHGALSYPGALDSAIRFNGLSTPGWTAFQINTDSSYHSTGHNDTFLLRFTLLSSDNLSNRDGWIIDSVWLFYGIPVGVPGVSAHSTASVYPNPSTGHFRLQSDKFVPGESKLIILDVSGKKVYEQQDLSELNQINMSLEPGTYFLKYNLSTGWEEQKIIIRR